MATRHQSKKPKKTQSVEVRVSEEDKSAFLAACRDAGRPASEVLRRLMKLFVIVQQQRRRYIKMTNMSFLKTASAGLATSAIALAIGASLLFAPVASAKGHLNYKISIEDGIGVIISQGSVDLDEEKMAEPVTEALGDAVQYELRATPCAQVEQPECLPGHVFIELDVLTRSDAAEDDQNAVSLIVREGDTALFERILKNGLTLTAFLEPMNAPLEN
ncbi:hypothetical protein [Parvularcula sp. IMCC14364]|uniref:hypothetical protein n=1 Tax=Parvularcula sp. IMCC14364 TaxID=3067902 RepID=UPI0027419DCA|nr:hypothetical protein [Parvularcula sp. IMCC14364]